MSLNVYLSVEQKCPHCAGRIGGDYVWGRDITHNLTRMAEEAGIYEAMWRPVEQAPPIVTAAEVLPLLKGGLAKLRSDPARFARFNPSNGWGNYDGLVEFVEEYIKACESFPTARIEVSR